jgi:hypothetical protein
LAKVVSPEDQLERTLGLLQSREQINENPTTEDRFAMIAIVMPAIPCQARFAPQLIAAGKEIHFR